MLGQQFGPLVLRNLDSLELHTVAYVGFRAAHPAALQLRLLETVVEVAAEKNSTLVLPFPVELLRFLERATPHPSERRDKATGTDAGAVSNAETLTLEPPRIPDDARGLELHTRIADTFQRDQ